jgi:hypothetical protein
MKARSKHPQLQRYTRNWATHEIMKTLIKNKRSYRKRIASEDDDQDSFMKDGGEGSGDDEDEKGNEGSEEENGDNYEEELEEDGDEGRNEDEEGNEGGGGDNYEGEGDSNDGEGNAGEGEDMYTEEGENAGKEGSTSFEGNGDEEESDGVDDRSAVGQQKGTDLEWKAAVGFGATTSQSAAAKKLKKSAATSKSAGKFKFKPAAVGLAGTKRKVPEDEDYGADQDAAATGRRNPVRNIKKPKKLRL